MFVVCVIRLPVFCCCLVAILQSLLNSFSGKCCLHLVCYSNNNFNFIKLLLYALVLSVRMCVNVWVSVWMAWRTND